MRLLFLSNYYPPNDHGGWEQWCQEVADALTARGHHVVVLTSRDGAQAADRHEPRVLRELDLESRPEQYRMLDYARGHYKGWRNRRTLKRTIDDLSPDVVMIWGMWLLGPHLAAAAEGLMPGRVSYYMCGYWPIEPDDHAKYWRLQPADATKRIIKGLIAPFLLWLHDKLQGARPEMHHVACVSQAVLDILRDGGLAMQDAKVIYGGIDLERFYVERSRWYDGDRPLASLYAGNLSREKGVHTLVEATRILVKDLGQERFHLTILGSGHPSFVREMTERVRALSLDDWITFHERVPKERMPEFLRQHDALVFPSTWQEPLARMMMEGMAAGLALVNTPNGGTREILHDGDNGLVFAAHDAAALAAQMARLIKDPSLLRRIAEQGQITARERLSLARMVNEIEQHLVETAGDSREPRGNP